LLQVPTRVALPQVVDRLCNQAGQDVTAPLAIERFNGRDNTAAIANSGKHTGTGNLRTACEIHH